MIPAIADKASLNPRTLVERGGIDALAQRLAATGYMVQDRILRDLAQSIKARIPLLVEGPRGSGKTALAEALAAGCNLPLFYLQGMEGLRIEEVLYSWDKDAQSQYVKEQILGGTPPVEARRGQWNAEYLNLGEVLAAFDYAAKHEDVPILVVDESDKLTEALEDMLLQVFGRGFAHVPRFGNVGTTDRDRWPIVVLTSNNLRHDLSPPMRSRCAYSYMELPSPRERVIILKTRVPTASPELVRCVAKLLFSIEGIPGIQDKPALREGITLLEAMVRDGVEGKVGEEILIEYLCLIVKREKDGRYLKDALARVARDISGSHFEIDAWVAEEFGRPQLKVA
jgi:MoxR-like ATPase